MKLYPPVIEGTIPAFYGTKISVPFSMNRSVSQKEVKGFALKIKTVQNQEIIDTILTPIDDLENFNWEIVNFSINSNNLKIGQFYKIQLAYYDIYNEIPRVGYYSTVGIVKYTAKPKIKIEQNGQTCLGIYSQEPENKEDKKVDVSEKVYSYCFNLIENENIIETSGEQIHNNSKDIEKYESIDSYTIKSDLVNGKNYVLEYIVKTINGLEIKEIKELDVVNNPDSNLKAEIDCDINYEEGYVDIGLIIKSKTANSAGLYYLLRSSDEDNFSSWNKVLEFSLDKYEPKEKKIKIWKDMIVKCGVSYKYAIQQYSLCHEFKSKRIESNKIYVDFEHAFLYDGERQLKIKYNPKISSFKNTLMETKVDTIGSKYPFIFRNGKVKYKEFSISGLLSYLSDEQSLFIDNKKFYENYYRRSTKAENSDIVYASNDLTSLNYQKEKEFKLEVLEWLNNGKPKLFKSPIEGNYIVRIMNVSLTPNDTVGRMLHTFNSTVYEIAENSYENLEKFNIFNIKNTIKDGLVRREINDLTNYRRNNKNLLENYKDVVSINLINLTKGDILEIKTNIETELIIINETGLYNINREDIQSIKLVNSSQSAVGGKMECFSKAPENFEPEIEFDNISEVNDIEIIRNILNGNKVNDILEYISEKNIDIKSIEKISFYKNGDENNIVIINGNKIIIMKNDEEYIFKNLLDIYEIKIEKDIVAEIFYYKNGQEESDI